MKYKLGQGIFIKAEISDIDNISKEYFVTLNPNSINWVSEDKIIPMDKTYADGLNDAWQMADKINNMPPDEVEEILGIETCREGIFSMITYAEALAKIEAYEKKKEIKPMDVVEHIGKEWIVSQVNDSEYLLWDGRNVIHVEKGTVKKVGSIGSLEQLAKLLRQIGE